MHPMFLTSHSTLTTTYSELAFLRQRCLTRVSGEAAEAAVLTYYRRCGLISELLSFPSPTAQLPAYDYISANGSDAGIAGWDSQGFI